jgi:6-phosphogluconate dehydrogenase
VIDETDPLLEEGDIIIVCGQTHISPTPFAREAKARRDRLALLLARASRVAEDGRAMNGPVAHAGGSPESYESRVPLLEDISAQKLMTCRVAPSVGPTGRHFVKMVHNGIEYADMQLIAEAYDLIKQGPVPLLQRLPRSSRPGTKVT